MEHIRAVIYDLDNTLIDSITMHAIAYLRVIRMFRRTAELEDVYPYLRHYEEDKNWHLLTGVFGIGESLDSLISKRNRIYMSVLASEVIERPGAKKSIRMFTGKHIPVGIGSNSPLSHINAAVTGLGLKDDILHVSSGEFLPHKPEPDIYIEAVSKLGMLPENTLAIEDSEHGIQSAKRAGLRVIAVPNRISKTTENFDQADIVFASLEQLTWDMFASSAPKVV